LKPKSMELRDPDLTQVQDTSLKYLKQHIGSLMNNFTKLMETTIIGHSESNEGQASQEAGESQEDEEEKRAPADVSQSSHADLNASIMKQQFQSSVCSHALVHATESLLKLVDALKMSRILHDADGIGGSVQELSRAFDSQAAAAQVQFDQLSERLAETMNEIDSRRLSGAPS